MQILIPRTDSTRSIFFFSVLFVLFFQIPQWTLTPIPTPPKEDRRRSEPVIVIHCLDWTTDTLSSYDLDFVLNNSLTLGNPDILASPKTIGTLPQTIPNGTWSEQGGTGPCNFAIKEVVEDSVRNLGFVYARAIGGEGLCEMNFFWRDRVEYSTCAEMQSTGIYARIYRRWSAICFGARKDTVQVILFRRPKIQDFRFNGNGRDIFDRVVTYEACSPDKSLIKKEDVTPFAPSFLHPKKVFIDQIDGKYAVVIKDREFPICGGKGVRIARELYVFDSCRGDYIDTFQVLIQIGTFKGPSIMVPTTIPALSLDSLNCSASFLATVEGLKSTFGVEVTGCHLGNVSLSIKTKKENNQPGDEWPTVNYPIKNKRVTGLLPGLHRVFVYAFDGCFGANQDSFDFVVKDKTAPKPICINGLSITLQPDGLGGGKYTLQATDFVAAGIYDCYGQGPDTNSNGQQLITQYSINKIGERVLQNKSTLNLTCADVGKVILIELHAWDTKGKDGYCVTYVEVRDLNRYCGIIEPPIGYVGGNIETVGSNPVQGVKMMLSIDALPYQFATTNLNGAYSFIFVPRGKSVLLEPELDKNPLNGVSTFDLLLIQKHILGIQALNSPYKMIAADVNNSKSISTLDLIQLRKLILGLDLQFLNNTSWRFVHAAFKFPKPENPWATQFAESIFVKEFNGSLTGNFIAIKIGDVNSNAKLDGASSNE